MKWKRSKVTIATREGPVTVSAHIYGHLAAHRPHNEPKGKSYKITHIPTGLSMSYRPLDCLDGAKACVERLYTLEIDWSKDRNGLWRDHKHAFKRVPVEIDRFRDFNLRRKFRL